MRIGKLAFLLAISANVFIPAARAPFALPNGWVWTRIGNVCYDFQYGTARKSTKNGNVPVLRMGNLRAGEIDYSDLVYTSDKDDIERYCLNPGDLLFNRTNSSEKVGKVSIFRGKKPCIYAGYLVRFRPVRSDSEFINYMMNSRYQWEFCQSVKTDAVNQSNISASKFIQFLVPLPPLAEQKRIVAKIKELFMVADLLDATTNNLMNTSKQIDKKILDLAIRGKLMSQDPNDEPASEIVKRIAASHKSPSKNHDAHIDPPFAIPQSWEWVRLGLLVQVISGVSYSKSAITESGIRILRGGNLNENAELTFYDDDVFISSNYYDNDNEIRCGDIVIVASTGSSKVIGRPAIAIHDMSGVQIGAFLRIVRTQDLELSKWIATLFCSRYYRTYIRKISKGTNIKNLKAEYITGFAIPLPPLAEQKRIVAKIEELRMVIKSLTT